MTIREITKSRTVWKARLARAKRLHTKWRKEALRLEGLAAKNGALKAQVTHANSKRVYWWRQVKSAQKMVDQRSRQLRTTPMEISQKGLEMLVRSEGFVPYVYADSRGFATFGVGHLIGQRRPTAADEKKWGSKQHPATRATVLNTLDNDLDSYEAQVRASIHGAMKQSEFDAFVHFAFNIGTGGFADSTVVKEHNAGHKRAAADAFLLWKRPPEILGRRHKERDLYLTGHYS